jgi:hypothetical protein
MKLREERQRRLKHETWTGDTEDAMNVGGRLVRRWLVRRSGIMTAQLEAGPVGRTRRVDAESSTCHREGVAVHQQGKDEEAGG